MFEHARPEDPHAEKSTAPKSYRRHLDLNIADLNPDLPTNWTWADYRAGRDPFTAVVVGRELVCPPG